MGIVDGRVVIVTGAGRGIGHSHAIALAAEGATVIVNDLGGEWDGTGSDSRPASEVVEEIKGMGGTASANFDDIADWEGGQRLVNQAVEEYGRLDALVCNAGFVRDRVLVNMTEDEWDDVIRVHLKGHFVPSRWAAAYWREQFKASEQPVNARIVLTASEAGLFGNAGQTNYSAAKAGIASMAIVMARELKRYGVTANAINPRARTRMTENTFGSMAGKPGEFDTNDPDNVSPWVVYLCSEHSGHISGQNFVCGGDQVALMGGWHRVNRIRKGKDRWSPSELVDAAAGLFGDRPTGPPKFGS